MKRLLLVMTLILVAGTASAFDATRRPERIAVLHADPAALHGHDLVIERAVRETLIRELRGRGFDVFDAGCTYDEAVEDGVDAQYVIEILGSNAEAVDYGGMDINGGSGGVSLALVTSRVAAEVIVYDAGTMEPLAKNALAKKNTALMPTGVGGGVGHAVFVWVATPFLERAQVRSVARAAARDAAMFVTSTIRAQ